jgi:hypothetical protein
MRHHHRMKATLKTRIDSWRTAFSDETTGIHKTLDDLTWQYASFRVVIRIVYIANQRQNPERPPLNEMVFDMIAEGYWARLLTAIRRLLDPTAIGGSRGVYSLRSVLKDIKACGPKITRRIYVEAIWEADYDLPALEVAHWKELRQAAGKPIWGDPRLMTSRLAHEHFDFLSGTTAEDRSEDDLMDLRIIERAEARVAKLDSIADHVTVHLAHSGNTTSREGKLLDNFGMPEARECLKELKEIADLVGMWFCRASGAGLATFIGDKFEGLDVAMIEPNRSQSLKESGEKSIKMSRRGT